MRGNGAELSRPRMERISRRMSPLSVLSLVPDCSRSNAGILFWPTYRSLTGSDSSSAPVLAVRLGSYCVPHVRNKPMARGQLSCRSDFRDDSGSSDSECCLFRLLDVAATLEALLEDAERFGLYEHSCGCSRLTQFSQGCLLSHFTLRWRQGQHAVPETEIV